jgi:cation diffusion facilitator family transporter
MHTSDPEAWTHSHDFLPGSHHRNERRTRFVIALTAAMMVVEIAAGIRFHSMALLADGWHMASHASALSITAFAYWFARRHRGNERYSFGTWKVGVLGGFASAVVLAVIAILVAAESFGRFFEPLSIGFDEAIAVACVGLVVNLVSAWLLREEHDHGPGHGDHHDHNLDHNLRAAYLHVLADALTSVTAIVALATGKLLGWIWMDPLMGLVGSAVIARWSYGLLRETSAVLLDGAVPDVLRARLRGALEDDTTDLVADLHVWMVGPGRLAAMVTIVADDPQPPEHYRKRLREVAELAHLTVEVEPCRVRSQPALPWPGMR